MAKRRIAPALDTLKPFRSFLFLKVISETNASRQVVALRDGFAELAGELGGTAEVAISARASRAGGLATAWATYRRDRIAPWTSDPAFADREHHLIVVSGFEYWVAVFMSDAGLRAKFKTALAEEELEVFDDVDLVTPGKLNAVFVNGKAKTLWLSSVQRRTSLKADHKVLSGESLQDALDPLGDQGYAFTAARCQNDLAANRSTYGVAPRKSRFWFRQSKNWDEYRSTAEALLRLIHESATEEEAPLPVLSVAIQGRTDPVSLGTAYEVSLAPQELANPADEAQGHAGRDEFLDLSFEILDGSAPGLTVEVTADDGQPAASYTLTFDIDSSGRVQWLVEPLPGVNGNPRTFSTLEANSGRLNVSFDAGFSISDGAVHRVRYRDLPFTGFEWADFAGFDVHREKPTPMNARTIGTTDSLFCWLKSRWETGRLAWLPQQGWLACNDGALEVADFIHLSDGPPAVLTLIHVKGAKNGRADRSLAVAPYEVVTSQAVKNLRHVDPQVVVDEFSRRLGRQVQAAVWQNGAAGRREDMLAAVVAQGANLARRVVVVQPHTRRLAREAALTRPEGSRERHLVRQLHSLLLGAQRDCSGVGAEFLVVGHEA